jgi:hypothetical protein
MRFSISPSDADSTRRRLLRLTRIAVGSLILAVADPGAVLLASEWNFDPWLRASTGAESDLILDPDFQRTVVEGGPFVDINPGVSLERALSRRALLRFTTLASFERFLNDQDRRLYGQSLWTNLYWTAGRSQRVRFSVGGSFFDDSERDTVRRWDAGGEAAWGLVNRQWKLEAVGGGRWRTYPHLDAVDDAGTVGTYSESSWNLGALASVLAGPRFLWQGRISRQGTVARDPFYDSSSWYLQGSALFFMAKRQQLRAFVSYQARDFGQRQPPEDDDAYLQLGLGLERAVRPNVDLRVQYAFARLTSPSGTGDTTHRVEVAFGWSFGSRGVVRSLVTTTIPATMPRADTRDGTVFRLHAPESSSVVLAGDFNGWSLDADVLRRAEDGWWELVLRLPPGIHQYMYVIDGVWTTPPEAESTVDDGFGNKNGLIEIRAEGRVTSDAVARPNE